jgi:hypothetical protein
MNIQSKQETRSKSRQSKRPPNAFLLFCRDERPTICERCPKMSPADVSSLLSHLWRSLDHESKAQYKEEELRLRNEYRPAWQEWTPRAAAEPFPLITSLPLPLPRPLVSLPPPLVRHSPPARVITRRFDTRPGAPKFPSELGIALPRAPIHAIAPDRGEPICLPS